MRISHINPGASSGRTTVAFLLAALLFGGYALGQNLISSGSAPSGWSTDGTTSTNTQTLAIGTGGRWTVVPSANDLLVKDNGTTYYTWNDATGVLAATYGYSTGVGNNGFVYSGNGVGFTSSTASGTNGFQCTTNGCRFDFGAGANDYASSDGTTVTFAGALAGAGTIQAATLLGANASGSSCLQLKDTTNTKTWSVINNNDEPDWYPNGAGTPTIKFGNSASVPLQVEMGTGAGFASTIATASVNSSVAGNAADTTEDVLMSYSLPANAMSANNKVVRVTAWGDNNAGVTTDVETVRCYFGHATVLASGTLLVTRVLTASQANTWRVTAEIVRTGATAQIASAQLLQGGTVVATVQTNSAPAGTTSGAMLVGCTGQRATTSSANSVRQLGQIVEFFN